MFEKGNVGVVPPSGTTKKKILYTESSTVLKLQSAFHGIIQTIVANSTLLFIVLLPILLCQSRENKILSSIQKAS